MISFSIKDRELKTDKKDERPKNVTEALEWSIAKWKFIAEHIDEIDIDGGPETCGLCKLFIDTKLSCQLCPVSIKTGFSSCSNTPYEEWDSLVDVMDVLDEDTLTSKRYAEKREQLKQAALKEVAFLESVQKEMPEIMDLEE